MIVIPARLGASRLPQKPLRLLGGKPLILRVWERVVGLEIADLVVIATDSQRIADVCSGATVAMTRTDHASGTDRVAEVALQSAYSTFDVIVNVQGDEPFVNADAIRGAATFVERGTYPLGTAAAIASPSIQSDPSVVKVVTDSHDRAMYFSRAPIPFSADSADARRLSETVKQHIGVYAYSREGLARWVALPPHNLERLERLEQLRPLADGMAMGVATVATIVGGGIDTEEDLILANARWTDTAPTAAGAP